MPVETVKVQAPDFGGFQAARLPTEQILTRLCCAKDCGDSGRVQLPFPGGYRIVCARHAVVAHMLLLGLLGDPSPVPEVREYARVLNADWDAIVNTEPVHPTMPIWFRCLKCSGGLEEVPLINGDLVSVSGISGTPYLHDCGG